MIKFLAIALLSLGSVIGTVAQAEPAVPYEHLADLTSQSGETMEAFLVRIGPQLRAYSDQTGFEACGQIASDGQGHFSVILGTNHAHIACVNDPDRVLPGMTAVGETIHSHGLHKQFSVNASDKMLMAKEVREALDKGRRTLLGGQDLEHFSPADYASGPGYLATPTGLIHQNGKEETVTVIQ